MSTTESTPGPTPAPGIIHAAEAMACAPPRFIDLYGLPLLQATEAQAVELMIHRRLTGQGTRTVTINLDILCRCARDPVIYEMVSGADLIVADGMPIIWASRLQKTPLPERVCGSNLIYSLSAAAAKRGLSVFLLGGAEPDLAPKTAEALKAVNPSLHVCGTWYPPFGFEKDASQWQAMGDAIAGAKPDVVFVALSFPKGERVIEQLRHNAPQAIWIAVGISFSFVCGEVKRAPNWVQKLGLEWLHRMVQEPGRLIRRYLIDDVPFAARLFWHCLKRRRGGHLPRA